MGQCDDGAICLGCTGVNEMLTYNKADEYACVVNEGAERIQKGLKLVKAG